MDDTLSLDLQQTDFGRDIDKEIKRLDGRIDDEAEARSAADLDIWQEINTIEAASDVVDVVGTYSELENYDTSKLHDKDLIKVLADETHDDAITYYRWSTSLGAFSYVGAEGPYYTTAETDALLGDKQDTLIAGNNIQIAADGKTISATSTTYTAGYGINISVSDEISIDQEDFSNLLPHGAIEFDNVPGPTGGRVLWSENMGQSVSIPLPIYDPFTGTDGQADGVAGLVPGPLTTDAGKFLKADGTWDTPPGTTYTAGTNIQINNDVISATDTTYSAGAGITIDANNAISADDQLHNLDLYAYFDGTNPEVFQYNNNRLPILFGGNIFWDSVNGCINAADTTYTAGTNVWISSGNVISATDTTYSAFTGATSAAAGAEGLVPAPASGDDDKFLKGDGTWGTVQSGSTLSVFYFDGTSHFYKDAGLTDSATAQEILTALESGTVYIKFKDNTLAFEDRYLQAISYRTESNRLYIQCTACVNGNTGESAFIRFTQFTNEERWNWSMTTVQKKLTAGTNISISGNTISATVPATNNISSNDWSALWQ